MADFAGLITIAVLLLATAVIWPVPTWILLGSIPVVFLINGLVWYAYPDSAMSPATALKISLKVIALVAVITIIYIGFGLIAGGRTIPEALLRGTPFWGVKVAALALGVFVGVPTLVRSVALFYERRST